jgi:hypothetical protein
MEEKLIINKELFGELKLMIQSSSEDDIVMAISILETADEWDRQNQRYKEQLYETLSENDHIKNKYALKMKVWLAMNDLDDKGIE